MQASDGSGQCSETEASKNFSRYGSLRKVLPAEHKDNLFGRQNEDLNKMYKKVRQEYIILAEYRMIQNHLIKGVYVIPSRESPFVWFGVIYVRSGPYQDGIFRFNIMLNQNFPDGDHPKVMFMSEMFHPVIHPTTNEVYLKDAFPTWNLSEQHIWQVLKYIHWIFYNLKASLMYAVNKDALDVYLNHPVEFQLRVKDLITESQQRIHDQPAVDDKHYLMFPRHNRDTHKINKLSMLSQYRNNSTHVGYSWVPAENFKPLGRLPNSDESESES